ncbi:FMN-binding negative transcriptional regulator [Streptomyces calidiresistens]|uniref:FMN-binding negative transcriptional regulator n=1 Tax=Streptomyces calidiresistens TaxID=1485586 RepID=A0A7W3XUS7_9ACTN|nr:FMN-binding negative transcriptional regulator [Streptomyces calidiresistens]MBB0228009.1 FMN-binding negative transcriptional regulator [Streptomyces calidiresistens]
MLIPPIYRVDEESWTVEIVDRHPLALLISNGKTVPEATQVPIVRRSASGNDQLTGTSLLGHMDRANPHWATLANGTAAKLIFMGPGGYVSPTLYNTDVAAPTWDFVTVHIHGTVTLAASLDEALSVVTTTARTLESRFGSGFDFEASYDYHSSLAPGVGAFSFHVEKVEAMFKFSQEKSPEIQERVIAWFADGNGVSCTDTAATMRKLGLGNGVEQKQEPGSAS